MTESKPMASELDRSDPMASLRDLFVGSESELVYFDGNSLGRPLRSSADTLSRFVTEQWGGRLIRGWDPGSGQGWFDLPLRLGDDLGRIALGAGPGQVFVGDSTTVLLYKLARAAVDAQLPEGRDEIVVDSDNFPTDRYLAEGIAAERGMTLRWIQVDPEAGVHPEQVALAVGEKTALVLLSHVAYRSAWLADGASITRIAHDAGALMLWDLSHSVGSVPVALDEWGADLAVGCSYKYLNGGPGAPAFAYVAKQLQGRLRQPIQGWMGHRDAFAMGPGYEPAEGMRGFISGTPPVLGMLAMAEMLTLIESVGMAAVRAKSIQLTEFAISLSDERLPGVEISSPRDSELRGGHVALTHPGMAGLTTWLWERDVIPDYRAPAGLRLGLSPLSTSFTEVERGVEAIRDGLAALK